ncbi:MAG: HNH endonuclease [Chloroflexi bacterium]|nr:MAG: HNH endonuclease [Chloroflexota bacterium]
MGLRPKSKGNNPDIIYAVIMRARFNRLKQTPEFKKWKRTQYFIQGEKCAWCSELMPRDFKDVHVDHAMPLFHGGRNEYDNLVLAHRKCNMEKWIRIDAVPQWILNRKRKYEMHLLRQQQRIIYNKVTEQILQEEQEELGAWMKDWL